MRPYCSRWQLATAFGFSLFLAFVAIGAKFFFDAIVLHELHRHLPISNASASSSFRLWKDIPFPIKNRFYFFHVENPLEVLEFGEPPILTQKGPFLYDQRRHKVDVRFSANGSAVSYKELSFYHFNAGGSVSVTESGSSPRPPSLHLHAGSTVIRVLNVPLLSVLQRARYFPFVERVVLDSLIVETKSTLFVERTVDELLWGYEDPLLVELRRIVPKLIPFTKFGWFAGKNGTKQSRFDVFTGKDGNLTRYLNIFEWNGKHRLDLWPASSNGSSSSTICNEIRGSDGSAFGPFVTPKKTLYTFAPQMCRASFASYYRREAWQSGIKTLRFEMDPQVFANASVDPAKTCYCTSSSSSSSLSCPPSGTLNISVCNYGAPIFLSQPHFLNADPSLARQFKGLAPTVTEHQTYYHIEPTSGVNVDAKGRLQLNGFVENLEDFRLLVFKNIVDRLVFPVFWVEIDGKMDDKSFGDLVKRRVVDQVRLVTALKAALVALAIFAVASTALLALQRWHYRRSLNRGRELLVPVLFAHES